jgi:phage shock protein A
MVPSHTDHAARQADEQQQVMGKRVAALETGYANLQKYLQQAVAAPAAATASPGEQQQQQPQ